LDQVSFVAQNVIVLVLAVVGVRDTTPGVPIGSYRGWTGEGEVIMRITKWIAIFIMLNIAPIVWIYFWCLFLATPDWRRTRRMYKKYRELLILDIKAQARL